MSTRWKREQHESVDAVASSVFAKCAKAVGARELDRDRNPQDALHPADDLHHLPFDIGGARAHVAGGVIDVQLEAVGAGFLELSRVAEPAAVCHAVERRHHRDAHRFLDPAEMLEILVRPERQQRFGREAGRLGHRVAEALDVHELVHLLAGDFLFVQRAEHQQGGARVFQCPGDVHLVAERPCADDQRMR
jgi:hypothetical protein